MGSVFKEQHRLDNLIYALKVISVHLPFSPEDESVTDSISSHSAMKEVEAISKLDHSNIVGYKGCWIEAVQPDHERIQKVLDKLKRREIL